MLLSSFFPEGIPFLNIEPNSLARNSIPPIPSLLEENDTENTIQAIALEKMKIPSASENILLLFCCWGFESLLPGHATLFWLTSDTADSIFISFELAPWLLGRAQREASQANLVLKFLLFFLSWFWIGLLKVGKVCLQRHDSTAANLSGLYLPWNSCRMAVLHVKGPVVVVIYQAGSAKPITRERPLTYHQLTFQPSPSIPRCCWVYNLGPPLTLKPTAPQFVFL